MMKRIIVVCEGPTEKEFCQDILLPHFQKLDIVIEAPLIKQSGGGIVAWRVLKSQLERHLAEGDAIVTTFIDYYGIRKDHEFPGWDASQKVPHKKVAGDRSVTRTDGYQSLCINPRPIPVSLSN